MSDHAVLAPSAAGCWVECPASVKHQQGRPEAEPHPTTVEGNAVHEISAKILDDFIYHERKGHTFNRASLLNTVASNGTVMTDELLDIVEVYVRDVMKVSDRFNGAAKVLVEHRVRMPQIHAENWGTLDASFDFHDFDAAILVIEDLKAGWLPIEVFGNWQLLNYTVGRLNEMIERNHPLPQRIELRLVQPRPYHQDGPVRVWTLTLAELEPYIVKMQKSAADAMGPDPTFRTGPHCTYCTGREDCPAFIKTGYNIVEVAKGLNVTKLSPSELGKHIAMLREAKALVDALSSAFEDKALIEIQNGRSVPGWEWSRTPGRRKFTVPDGDVIAMGDVCGVDLRVTSVPTPKQAMDKGVPEEYIKSISAQVPGSVKLSPVDLRKAKHVFKQPE